ncbi:unnamed protein product [marine sediment metagenome]|uniref:Uncharacterized protein n=1 Tax=marine sediment metagenome TaxID=412755 RepID=X0T6P2_9ZZZZ
MEINVTVDDQLYTICAWKEPNGKTSLRVYVHPTKRLILDQKASNAVCIQTVDASKEGGKDE